ncbi:MAG: WD40 repeat domain-containing protein, partial [Gemmatimonadetes bacterium]|nr:WD40 repeat domain-containing protein [Gemmatimonadota bacterium]
QLRDQLRQAAHTWEERGRSDDMLWTGSAYREFAVWRERYPGGLTETEEAFGKAMTRHVERRRRRRRAAVAAAFAILVAVLAVIGGFWQRSVSEARRAEAANLISLAQLQLEKHPSATIAYAIASLELADNPEVRRLAVEALWIGPTEFRLPTPAYFMYSLDFSADGRWLATAEPGGRGNLWPSDGGPPTMLEGGDLAGEIRTSPRGDLVAATMSGRRELGLWSFPEGRLLRSLALGDRGDTFVFQFSPSGERLLTYTESPADDGHEIEIRSWPVAGGEPKSLARIQVPEESAGAIMDMDPTGSHIAWADGRRVRIARLEGTTLQPASATSVEHDRTIAGQIFDEQGRQLATSDTGGTIRIWSLERDPPELTHTLDGERGLFSVSILFDPSGSMLAGAGFLWDLTAPPDAEPLRVRGSYGLAFTPDSRWLATGGGTSVSLWPLARTYPQVLPGHEDWMLGVAFTPDGKQLVSTSEDRSVRLCPLDSSSGERSRILYRAEGALGAPRQLAMAPDGSFVVIGNPLGEILILPLDGEPVRELGGFTDHISGLAVGPQARLVAAGSGQYKKIEAIVRVWDLVTGDTRILDAGDGERIRYLKFTAEGELLVHSGHKLRRWDLERDAPRIVAEIDLSVPGATSFRIGGLSPDSRWVLFIASFGRERRLWIHDLDTGSSRELGSRGRGIIAATFDPTGSIIVSGDTQGIRVGPTRGGEPHLLLASERSITHLAVSPDGRWIVSEAEDYAIRLWPMPNLSEPPLHTLPRDELLTKLRSLTNLRAVRDQDSSTGWKL